MSIKEELLFDFALNMPRVLVTGKTTVLDNVKKVMLLTDSQIVVFNGQKYTSVTGDGFVITELKEGRMLVSGEVEEIRFLRHYRKIKVEGTDLNGIVNKCMKNGIHMRNLRWKNPLEFTVEIKGDDLAGLKKTAGHSYKVTVLKEGGVIPLFKTMKANITAIIGAFLVGAFIFYQSLFVAEIRIDGYRSISEENLRKVIADAGLYEGVRKPEDYNSIKEAVYREFDEITWVSVYEDGRLVEIDVSEASKQEEAQAEEDVPVNIVADRSGMIEKILPLKGNAVVQKGDYVNKGDVLISGAFEYQSSDYSRGDDIFTMYSHASGQVYAKAPCRLTYYLEKNERIREKTGRFIPGIYIKLGDAEVDTAAALNSYEASERNEIKLVDIVKPLPVKISLVKTEEVVIRERHRDMTKVKDVVEAAVRQYSKDNLKDGEEIVSRTIDYSESEGVIRADVLLEVMEEIGTEKVIKVKKEKKTEEQGEQDE